MVDASPASPRPLTGWHRTGWTRKRHSRLSTLELLPCPSVRDTDFSLASNVGCGAGMLLNLIHSLGSHKTVGKAKRAPVGMGNVSVIEPQKPV